MTKEKWLESETPYIDGELYAKKMAELGVELEVEESTEFEISLTEEELERVVDSRRTEDNTDPDITEGVLKGMLMAQSRTEYELNPVPLKNQVETFGQPNGDILTEEFVEEHKDNNWVEVLLELDEEEEEEKCPVLSSDEIHFIRNWILQDAKSTWAIRELQLTGFRGRRLSRLTVAVALDRLADDEDKCKEILEAFVKMFAINNQEFDYNCPSLQEIMEPLVSLKALRENFLGKAA